MRHYFEGTYYKHQKKGRTLCVIVGRCDNEKFIQVITDDFSAKVPFTRGNYFSKKGITLNIHAKEFTLHGTIKYYDLSPIKYDIMGPFRFFPMECRHEINSMSHRLEGTVWFNEEEIDFTGGKGYMEGDSGSSFPSSYVWVHANDFKEPCSIVASVAKIPFCGLHFRGCICVIHYRGREYRLATYLGVRVLTCTENRIVLRQGRYRLEIEVCSLNGQALRAPQNGKMVRTIREEASCPAQFHFYEKGIPLFHLYSRHASFEYEL